MGLNLQRLDEKLLVDNTLVNQNGAETFVPRLLQGKRLIQLFLRDGAVVDENIA